MVTKITEHVQIEYLYEFSWDLSRLRRDKTHLHPKPETLTPPLTWLGVVDDFRTFFIHNPEFVTTNIAVI